MMSIKKIIWKEGTIFVVESRDKHKNPYVVYGMITPNNESILITTLPRAQEIKPNQPIPKRAQRLTDPHMIRELRSFFLAGANLFNWKIVIHT